MDNPPHVLTRSHSKKSEQRQMEAKDIKIALYSCFAVLAIHIPIWDSNNPYSKYVEFGDCLGVRAAFPRYRYDQLMRLGWKVFLPLSLAWVVFVAGTLISFNWLP